VKRLLTAILPFLFLCLTLRAKELGDYQIGDVARTDILTPVSLDVEDTAATAALQSAQAEKYPSIFRHLSGVTNDIAREFLSGFSQARIRFQKQLTNEFSSYPLDDATIHSANFGNFVTAFGIENRKFPVTDKLAAEWARGNDGQSIQEKLLRTLLWVEGRPIYPDILPAGMTVGRAVRLVPVNSLDERLPLETVQAVPVTPASGLMTVSNAQAMFRREFPAQDQLLARAVAAFIKANCFPDQPFTQLTRGTAVCDLVVSDHFDAGDVIVHRGTIIDHKIKARLITLNEKLKSTAPPPIPPADATVTEQSPTLPPPAAPTARTSEPTTTTASSESEFPHHALILGLASISIAALGITGWLFYKKRKYGMRSGVLPNEPSQPDTGTQAREVSHLLREAVQRELVSQRGNLLWAQQAASEEINTLVHRLDELHTPMQERLQTYEARIQMLEKELAIRDEENRQLLKMKIDMITRQMESERAGS